MSAIVMVEERPPVGIRLLARVSTYAHFFESVVATLLFWMCPSLTPKVPALHIIPPSPRHLDCSVSIHSLGSTTSTLVDCLSIDDEASDELPDTKEVEDFSRCPKFWSRRSSPLIPSPALSLARRMSVPARRFSEHISSTLASLQTPAPEIDPISYFGAREIIEVEIEVDVREIETAVDYSEVLVVDESVIACSAEVLTHRTTKRVTKLKKITKKAKSFLRVGRRS